MKLKDYLTDVKFGLPQSAGNQIVIPILADTEITDIGSETLTQITNDRDYSRLTLKNIAGKPIILPQGARFETEGKGQDRTTLSSTLLEPEENKELRVGCVQPSEGTHMEQGEHEFSFIPARLRIPALAGRDSGNYNVIWDDISKYLRESGVKSGALRDFYKVFAKELEEFVAQFERVEKQRGAVILINGEVTGIELYPNYSAWANIWKFLVRDCYGAEAIKQIKKKRAIAFKPLLNLDKITDITSLENQVLSVTGKFVEFAVEKVNPFLEEDMEENVTETGSDFDVKTLNSNNFAGQTINYNNQLVYASLIRK